MVKPGFHIVVIVVIQLVIVRNQVLQQLLLNGNASLIFAIILAISQQLL